EAIKAFRQYGQSRLHYDSSFLKTAPNKDFFKLEIAHYLHFVTSICQNIYRRVCKRGFTPSP
ncbi:MAG: hypothetical protein LW809_07320, partial [Vampirovibrionales bacterium]|nr:hypothetical protein [Vampirovibrionales bacterium]